LIGQTVAVAVSISEREKSRIEATFARHVNRGQLDYLRAGHLDVLERERQGVTFVDAGSGRRMIDAFSSAGSFNVGRHNPEVLRALDEALDELDIGSSELLSRPKIALARRLTRLAPGDLDRVIFAAGGGDAVDGALKLARGATGRGGVIAAVKAYHGHTGFSLSAIGKEHYRAYCEPLMPGFSFAPFNDLAAAERVATGETAAIIVEPVQGEAGIYVGEPDYLRGLRRLCDERGILLIFDEIQTGFGRTGRLFAAEHSGVVPDLMTVAKSMGGGLFPNAAILYRPLPAIASYLERNPGFHSSASGGSDLGCRVSLAVLDLLERERLWENAEQMGSRLKAALERLQRDNPRVIREVRGLGLMLGLEYIHEFLGPLMSDALAREGVFAAYSGNAPQVMRFMVPITVTGEEMDALIAAIGRAVKRMNRLLPLLLPLARIPAVRNALNDVGWQTRVFSGLRRVEELAARWLGGGRADG
jgi:acetylornithine/succinyldiaminopimelate/putrescine aminotransferase